MDIRAYNIELLLRMASHAGPELAGEAVMLQCDEVLGFSSALELAYLIDEASRRGCPHLEQKTRSWGRKLPSSACTPMSEPMRLTHSRHTFHVSIQFAEHHTWQGTIRWLEGRQSRHFRSFLELLRLVEEASKSSLSQVATPVGL